MNATRDSTEGTDVQNIPAYRPYCLDCGHDGNEMARSTAEQLVEWHNEEHHDGEQVAEVEEVL